MVYALAPQTRGGKSMFSTAEADVLRPQKVSQQIISKIRNAILSNTMQPGAKLPNEAQLMQHFGVSRQTMREALCALESMGLLNIKTGLHGGAYVRPVDMDVAQTSLSNFLFGRDFTIAHITEVRLCFEPHAARVASQSMSAEDKSSLRQLLEQCRQTLEEDGDIKHLRALEMSFHECIVRATGNPVFMLMHAFSEKLLGNIKERLKTQRDFSLSVLACHERILEALERGDADGAEEFMRLDIQHVAQSLNQLADEEISIHLL